MASFQTESSSVVQGSKLLITISAMMASLMAVLDISIVNVALNDIRASFGAQMDQVAWISTGYMMANVVVIPMTGYFQNRFGLKNYFLFSITLFIIASVLCALSWNLLSLVIFRILQGAGGGAIIPTASTILISRYPREEQGMAQAFIGLGAITGPLLGPTIGGYLIDYSSWHLIFLINLPIGILALIMSASSIKIENFIPSKETLDRYGFALLAVGLASLQFILEEGNRDDWFASNAIIFFSVLSLACLVTLIFQQLESKKPMINFRVFTEWNYLFCTLINFLLGTVLFGVSFLFSLYCANVMQYSPLNIGLLFLKGTFIQIIVMPLIGKVVKFIDNRYLIVFGIILVTFSLWLNSNLNQASSEFDLITILFIRSIGLACLFIPLSVIAISRIPTKELGNAVGLFNLTRELGGSIGIAWMSSLLVNHIKEFDFLLKAKVNIGNEVAENQLKMMEAILVGKVSDAKQAALQLLQVRVNLQSTIEAFNSGFFILAFLFSTSLFFIMLIKKQKKINLEEKKSA
ncbi:DHA2 family efflux MFS transporter permease subunit [Fluviispira multicolorata]|uniref:DHA2 family efflux MFS transporter permease subunit n=1 Tax=Fluviispira multicolorata TaxID=2654512 RepID=A0A833JE69_9BACT|nr:DHA2 family efflux MFS transporter permease subunit [Fluviispira multicolorata]KAB8032240.1 DHA2 family efflux MFS transporter permease subunit [Fluviispira multicolorata]